MLNIYIYFEAPSILNTCSNRHLYGIYEFVQFMVYGNCSTCVLSCHSKCMTDFLNGII